MNRAVGLVLLCLIAASAAGCARRSSRAVQLPGVQATASKAQKPSRTGEAARKMRDAIRSLKEKITPGKDTPRADEPTVPETAAETSSPTATTGAVGTPGQVGTAGAWSVETRYPTPPGGGASQSVQSGPQSRGRLLSRAGQAVRQAGGGSWGGVIALCAIAFALVAAALAVRRSRHTT